MSDQDHIRRTAEGMIRNFGAEAADRAEGVGRRHMTPTGEENILWQAVAEEIRAMQAQRPVRSVS